VPENKEDKKTFLTPAGAMIALICFFLPWVKISCGRSTKSFSGPDIGGIFWLVLIAALVMVIAFFYFRRKNQPEKSKYVAIIGSIMALLAIIVRYISLVYGQNGIWVKAGTKAVRFKVQMGAIGTIFGLILVITGAVFIETHNKPKQEPLRYKMKSHR
jgi:glucan phosphoethanolaminetransferase (alkaline phosphatase superfamily)